MPFLGFRVKVEEKNGGFWSENGGFERGWGGEDRDTQVMWGKLKSFEKLFDF